MTEPDSQHRQAGKQAGVRALPRIDINRCEGKAACVPACPWDALAIITVPKAARTGLTLAGWVKGTAHRWKQAHLADPDACRGCLACSRVCPENAISFDAIAAPATE